jgi:4-amino-4-deoxy-L-arabinose transferase-like glycosyltransferase
LAVLNVRVTRFLDSPITRAALFVLAAVLFAVANLPWQLDDFDQAKQAFTSFEMVERGHWFYQHTPNWWVATKPPFVGWISALLFEITRSWELAWRLPSFLTALALLILIFRAASVYGPLAAVVAASAFAFNLFTLRLASLVRTDMALALVIFAVGLLIWAKIRTGKIWTSRDRIALFLLLSAGMLIKGPIVYALLVPGLVLVQWWKRRHPPVTVALSGWLPWLLSFLVFLIWVAGGILFVPEFTEHVVLREFAGRFGGEVHRAQPIYFYLPHLLHRFAPWSLLLLGFGFLLWKSSRGRMEPETVWLLGWILGGLLVLSIIPSKRIDRIFPIVPPLCLLLGAMAGRLRNREAVRPIVDGTCAVALLLAAIFLSGYTARKVVVAYRKKQDAFAVFGRQVVREAAAHGWRYEVVGGEDEGMLLYTRRTEFLDPGPAAANWNAGNLNALVVPSDEIEDLLPTLEGGAPKTALSSGPGGRYRKRYFLLVRSGTF